MDDSKMVTFLEHEIKYADVSYSYELMCETYGMIKMASMCGELSKSNYVELASRVCRNYFNNPEWFKKARS